ncbi:hypothetical protein CEP51_011474 [Fusarium floridanum]|uniref:Uncharacterized protein n=1 Tax=Fusarium floridanum TaxID=1325733 RepID=A0A428RB07_9HYPO|nr:hypothetical protein CEP51_011474 [Fusarium floridanum]
MANLQAEEAMEQAKTVDVFALATVCINGYLPSLQSTLQTTEEKDQTMVNSFTDTLNAELEVKLLSVEAAGDGLDIARHDLVCRLSRLQRSSSSVIPTLTIIKNTFLTYHSIISQC